jgi:hypothetical protein
MKRTTYIAFRPDSREKAGAQRTSSMPSLMEGSALASNSEPSLVFKIREGVIHFHRKLG